MPGQGVEIFRSLASMLRALPRTLLVAPSGGHYSTLSGALAAIVDAAANNQYQIIVVGNIAETDTVTAKSHIHVTGFAGASVTVTKNGTGNGFVFQSITNTVWRGLRLVRAGAVPAQYISCVSIGGTSGPTVRLEDCRMENETTGQQYAYGLYVGGTSTPTILRCRGIGAAGNDNCHGGAIAESSMATVEQCSFIGGSGGAGCSGLNVSQGAAPTLASCTAVGGDGGTTCYGMAVREGAAPLIRNCDTKLANSAGSAVVTVTTTIVLHATKPHQLGALYIYVNTAGGAASTLSIGTALAGTDIVNAQAIATTGAKFPTLGAGALTLLPGGTTLHVTIDPDGGAPNVTIYYDSYISYADCYALYLTTVGAVRIELCALLSNCASDAVSASAAAVTASKARVTNCSITARPKEAASKKAILAAAAWNSAPFYKCTLVGGTTNITADAGASNGSNIIPS